MRKGTVSNSLFRTLPELVCHVPFLFGNDGFEKYHLVIYSYLELIAFETAHILDQNYINITCVDFFKHCLKTGAIEVGSDITVVCKVTDVAKTFLSRAFFLLSQI